MGEITNVIAGQAKALLHGTPHHFSFSPPVVTGPSAGLKLPENMDSLVLAFDSDVGGCALQLCTPRRGMLLAPLSPLYSGGEGPGVRGTSCQKRCGL